MGHIAIDVSNLYIFSLILDDEVAKLPLILGEFQFSVFSRFHFCVIYPLSVILSCLQAM
jgi:hypothetical protein